VTAREKTASRHYKPASVEDLDMQDARALMDRIQALPPERIAEVADFVDFLAAWEQDRALTRGAAGISAPAFAAIWDNPEDSVYDAL
jgi:hypothetical protein